MKRKPEEVHHTKRNVYRNSFRGGSVPMTLTTLKMSRKRAIRKCRIRINLKRFESIILTNEGWGFREFTHCLN